MSIVNAGRSSRSQGRKSRGFIKQLLLLAVLLLAASGAQANNTVLTITTDVPDSACPGQPFTVCAQVMEACGGSQYAPLPNRPIYFFLNTGGCGVGSSLIPTDSAFTDSNGVACTTIPIPATNGMYSLRVKFNGESKPAGNEPPNGACDPTKRVQLSASNDCEELVVSESACQYPPETTCPGDTTVLLCDFGQVCLTGFHCFDPDGNLESCEVSLGTLVDSTVCFTATAAGTYEIVLSAGDAYLNTASCTTVVTVLLNSAPAVQLPADTSVFLCDATEFCFPVDITDVNCNVVSVTTNYGSYAGTAAGFDQIARLNEMGATVTQVGGGAPGTVLYSADDFIAPINTQSGVSVGLPNFGFADYVVDYGSFTSGPTPANSADHLLGSPTDLTFTTAGIGGPDGGDGDGSIAFASGNYCVLGLYNPVTVCNGSATDLFLFTNTGGSGTIELQFRLGGSLVHTAAQAIAAATTGSGLGGITFDLPDGLVYDRIRIASLGGTVEIDGMAARTAPSSTTTDVCFTATTTGTYDLIVTATDSCGLIGADTMTVTVLLNRPPVANAGDNQTVSMCEPSEICFGVAFSDPDNNLALTEKVSGPGTLAGNQICFTPTGAGSYTFIIRAVDDCGLQDFDTVVVTVDGNQAPVADEPDDIVIFLCDAIQLCHTFTATDPDGDDLTWTKLAGVGTVDANGQFCFTPTTSGMYAVAAIVSDSCGVSDTVSIKYTVTLNSAPVATDPGAPADLFQCDPAQVCYSFAATDVNGGTLTWTMLSGAGAVSAAGQWCFTPAGAGAYTVTAQVADSCGDADTVSHTYNITINQPPTVALTADTALSLCTPQEICLAYTVNDPDAGDVWSETMVAGYGVIDTVANRICFTPTTDGMYQFIIGVTDECGETDVDTALVLVSFGDVAAITCPTNPIAVSLCTADQVCQMLAVTPATATVTTSFGTYSAGQLCFQADTSGTYEIVVIAAEDCGSDTCTVTFNVEIGVAASITCPAPQILTLCTADTVCVPVSINGSNLSVTVSPIGWYSAGSVCFVADTTGNYEITVIADTPCGSDTCSYTVDVTLNTPPVAVAPTSPVDTFLCASAQVCYQFAATDIDGGALTWSRLSGNGTVSASGLWCFTASTGSYSVSAVVSDACGAKDTVSLTYNVTINSAPTIALGIDTTIFQCTPTALCLPYTVSDVNSNISLVEILAGAPGATLDEPNSQFCFTPAAAGSYSFILRVTDACGRTDQDTIVVTMGINSPPVVSLGTDRTLFACTLAQLCLPVTSSDPDNNLTGLSLLSGPGTLAGGQICFTPGGSGVYEFIVEATDACGATDRDTLLVTYTLNSPPVAAAGADQTVFQCTPTPICWPASGTDPDGNLSSVTLIQGPGTYNGLQICFTPTGDGSYLFVLQATDACGETDLDSVTIDVAANDAPVCTVPNDTTIFQCLAQEVCLPAYATDANGNLRACQIISGPGSLEGGNWCYTPASDQVVTVTMRCTDSCGAYCESRFTVEFDINSPPQIAFGADINTFQCTPTEICLPYTANDPEGLGTTTITLISGPGVLDLPNSRVCFTPTVAGTSTFIVRIVDECNRMDYDTINVTVALNRVPVVNAGSDQDVFLCQFGTEICWPASVTDADNNLTSVNLVGPGTYDGFEICFNPTTSGDYDFILEATDVCGVHRADTVTIIVTNNEPPTVQLPADSSVFLCTPTEICFGYTGSDVDGTRLTEAMLSGYGTLDTAANQICFTPSTAGTYEFVVRVTDSCGAIDQDTMVVTVEFGAFATINCPTSAYNEFLCTPGQICRTLTVSPSGAIVTTSFGTWSAGQLCFPADTSGTYVIEVIAASDCSADTCEVTFNVQIGTAAQVECPTPQTFFLCAAQTLVVPITVSGTSPSVAVSPIGWYSGGKVYFMADTTGHYVITVIATGTCGADTCQVIADVTINTPPVADTPAPLDTFLCVSSQLCYTFTASDVNGGTLTWSRLSGAGTVSTAGQWCFTPSTAGTYTVTARVTDQCGAADTVSATYTVSLNAPPQIAFGADIDTFLCAAAEICLPYTASDPQGLGTTTISLISGPGTLDLGNSRVCFTPTLSGVSTFIIGITDVCNRTDYDTINVTIDLNRPPVADAGLDASHFLCDPGTSICWPASGSDPDGNLASVVLISGPGSYSGGQICFSPMASGVYPFILQATDACGAVDVDTALITVTLNQPPLVILPNDTSIFLCAPQELCFPYTASDPDGSILTELMTSGFGTIDTAANQFCFTPTTAGTYEFVVEVTDSCGATDTETLVVTVTFGEFAAINCPTNPIAVSLCAAEQICYLLTIQPSGATAITSFGSYANGELCFDADTTGTYVIQVIAATDCSADTCLLTFNVDIGSAAQITCPGPQEFFICEPDTVCVPVTVVMKSDTVTVSPIGWYSGGNICFVADTSGHYELTVVAATSCGSDSCTIIADVTLNTPPVAVAPTSPVDTFLCASAQVCYQFAATDIDGGALTWSRLSGNGTVSASGLWCFTASTGSYSVSAVVSDACGAKDTVSLTYNVTINSAPTIALGIDTTIFQCTPTALCLPYTVSDVNSNISLVEILAGAPGATLDEPNSQFCFTPAAAGSYSFILRVTDACGRTDQDTIVVTIGINSPPVVSLGADQTLFACTLAQLCLPVTSSDPDNNLTALSLLSGPGTLAGGQICFTPGGSGVYEFIVEATDACGATDRDTLLVTYTLNSPPVVTLPNDTSIFLCTSQELCFPYLSSDPDGGILTELMTSGFGAIDTAANQFCFTPGNPGTYEFTIEVTDSCGATDSETLVVTITFGSFVSIDCPTQPVDIFLCAAGQTCYELDIQPTDAVVSVSYGSYANGELCFNADTTGTYEIEVIAASDCGADTCVITFNVELNIPAAVTCPPVQQFDLCAADSVCAPVTVSGTGVTVSVEPFGWYAGGEVCFFADTAGTYELTVIATGSCDADTCVLVAEVALNAAPIATEEDPFELFLCTAGQVCDTLTATDPDSDPLTWSRLSGAGTISAAGIWCFTPTASGTYTVTAKVTDPCGLADTVTITYHVTLNSAPVVDLGGGRLNRLNTFQCDPGQQCLPYTVTDPDDNVVLEELIGGTGTLDTLANDLCFTADTSGLYRFIVRVEDACGASDIDTLEITLTINRPPVANAGADQQVFLCNTTPICWPASGTDPDANLDSCYIITSVGSYSGGQICFTPDTAGLYTFILRAVDACGESDQDTAYVTVALNTAPVCNVPGDTTISQCAPAQVRLPVAATDVDGNLDRCEIVTGPGSIQSDEWVYTPTADQTVTVQILCIDSCGTVCTGSFTVTFDVNEPPLVNLGPDTTIFLCEPQQVCRSVTISDAEGNLQTTAVISPAGATLNGNQLCFTPIVGQSTYPLIVEAIDSCGRMRRDTSVVTVQYNRPPALTVTPNFSIYLDFAGEVCFNVAATDPDNNLGPVSVTAPATLAANQACFWADTSGQYCFVVTAPDACGLVVIDTICVTVAIDECIHVRIEKTHGSFQGHHEFVNIFQQGSGKEIGGFDLLVQFDPTVLMFNSAIPGDLLEQCGWEYFTYRQGPFGNCSGCPNGLLRIVAIAETNDGANHPGCFLQDLTGTLATLDFLVSNDRNYECQYAPVRFFWVDCADNSISSRTGDTLWISRHVFDFELNDITATAGTVPGYTGAPDMCISSGGPGKPSTVRCVDFTNGGVDIICAEDIDARGDINLDGAMNTIADAVLYSNYFVYGLGVFTVNIEGQIAASDVNADGIPLSVGDLVYLIRVVVGDALPYPKLDPNRSVVEMALVDGMLEIRQTEYEIGAIALTLEGDVRPELHPDAQGMEMRYSFDGSETRVLIYNLEAAATLTGGKILHVGRDAKIKTVDVGAFDGFTLAARIDHLPSSFALSQNYPNPFNPTTTIEFALPKTTDWELRIFNVLGQTVETFKGSQDVGYMKIAWDAGRYASGVYLYRLTAGEFSATKKMVLLK